MHRSQIFGYLLISFLVGIFIGPWFVDVVFVTLIFILAGTIVITVSGYERTFVKTKKAERNRRMGIVFGACILAVGFGMFRYGQADSNNSVLLSFADQQVGGKGISVNVRGTVDNEMTIYEDKGQLVLHVQELSVPGHTIKVDERTLLFLKSSPVYKIGDKLSVVGALQKPTNFAPGFDYVQYLKNKEIRTTIPYPKISFDPSISVPLFQRGKIALYRVIFDIKDRFQSTISTSLPEPYAAYIDGVLLGTRQNIPPALTDAFNKTSTTHILAISGYNITIIAEGLLALMVLFMPRKKAFWISVAAIIVFTIMTGAGASVVRAAIMGLLLLFANGFSRLYDPKNSILFAAGVMVFLDPLALRFDVGFQLSFLAVIGLIYVYPILEQKCSGVRVWKGLKETLLMSLAAQIMVAPLLAYVFHTFSLVSLPANLLILPFMPYVMLFGFLAGVGGLVFAPLGQAIGLVAWALGAYQVHVVEWMAALPFSSITITLTTLMLVALYTFIIIGVWKNRLSRLQSV